MPLRVARLMSAGFSRELAERILAADYWFGEAGSSGLRAQNLDTLERLAYYWKRRGGRQSITNHHAFRPGDALIIERILRDHNLI